MSHTDHHSTGTGPDKPYWNDALAAFGRMSTWILGPILVALFAGKWLDAKYHTAPVIFLSLTGLAFVMSTFGLIVEGKKYMKKVSDEAEKKEKEKAQTQTNERNEPDHN